MNAKIANMSLAAACLVVLLHALYGLNAFFPRFVCYGVCQCAVPFFFVVSGYFLARHFGEKGWYRKECKKRLRSLLLPFLLWGFVALAYYTFFAVLLDLFQSKPIGTHISWSLFSALGFNPFSLPLHGVLWYLRTLFVLVLISPLLKFLVERFGLLWVVSLFALNISYPYVDAVLGVEALRECGLFAVRGLAYFSLGLLLRRNGLKGSGVFDSPIFTYVFLAVGLIACGLYSLQVWGGPSMECVRNGGTVFLLSAFWRLMPNVVLPKVCVSKSFAIFLLHQFVLRLPIWYLLPFNAWQFLCVRLLVAFGAIAASVAFAEMTSRRFPRFHAIAFGGR